MRGHWIGGTRKLNKHWQSGEGGHAEFSRWFTTIKRGDDYYCFAPSYANLRTNTVHVRADDWSIYPAVKNVWTSLGTFTLTPSFNGNMTVGDSYTLEDIRENGQIVTRTLDASSRVKVIIPTFNISIYVAEETTPPPITLGYTYSSSPIVPTGAEILWQDNNDASSYQSRYSDSLNLTRNAWNAWGSAFYQSTNQKWCIDEWAPVIDGDAWANLLVGFYDYDTSITGTPQAINLLSAAMFQRRTGELANLIIPFNNYEIITSYLTDYAEHKPYAIWYKLELVSLDLQERTIV